MRSVVGDDCDFHDLHVGGAVSSGDVRASEPESVSVREDTHLVFVTGRAGGEPRDQTAEIEKIGLDGEGFAVTFKRNRTVYRYSPARLQILERPEIRWSKGDLVVVDGRVRRRVVMTADFGQWTKLFFESGSDLVATSSVIYDRNGLADSGVRSAFDYLLAVAALLPHSESDRSFLARELEGIAHLSDQCVLSAYLAGRLAEREDVGAVDLFPFGVNLSQKRAVRRAFENQISSIQGPPGTGKTQTILNIVANALYRGKTVAVVSGNNSATENVFEKLDRAGYGFLAARLGNRQNQAAFFGEDYPECVDLDGGAEEAEGAGSEDELERIVEGLDRQLELIVERSRLRERKSRLLTEQRHFLDRFPRVDLLRGRWASRRNWSGRRILEFLTALELRTGADSRIGWWHRIGLFSKFGVWRLSGRDVSETVRWLHQWYYDVSIAQCVRGMAGIDATLESGDFQSLMGRQRAASERLMRREIGRAMKKVSGHRFVAADIRSDFAAFSRRCSTVCIPSIPQCWSHCSRGRSQCRNTNRRTSFMN
jgi:hypothetical protein